MSVLFSSTELIKPKFRTRPAPRKREDDLLVFGYACTIHENSSKALYFEQEKHLIPWMGDEAFLIGRYDARLHFTDQSQFVPKPSDLNQKLSPEEEEIERLCDEERYCDLNKDMSEHEIHQEEEMKRFQQAVAYDGAYNAAPFLYGDSTAIGQQPQKQLGPNNFGSHYPGVKPGPQAVYQEAVQPGGVTADSSDVQAENQEAVTEELEPFVPPEELDVPQDMEIPETVKMNAIVGKTALFVSKQGQQMEILIKAKQSGNPQFEFLNFGNWLNPYYKHMLKYVKEGKYTPQVAKEQTPPPEEPEDKEDLDDESDGEYELHPLLQASLHKKLGNSSAASTPSVDKMFGLSFMRSFQPAGAPSSLVPVTSGIEETCMTSESEQEQVDQLGHNMWYTTSLMHYNQGSSEIPISQSGYGPAMFESYVSSAGYHYLPPSASVTSVADMIPPPPPPPGEGPLEEEWMDTTTCSVPVYPPPPPHPFLLPDIMSGAFAATPAPPGVLPVPQAAEIVPPPPDIQPIVDKLADYVARNGGDFEAIVKKKNDDRFAFLNPWDVHHPYYLYRKQLCKEENEQQGLGSDQHSVGSSTIVKGPISFSIKAKDTKKPKIEYRTSVIYKQSYELGESDEEENEKKREEDKEATENGSGGKRSILEIAGMSEEQNETEQANEADVRDMKEQMMSIEAAEREVMRLEAESRDKQIQLERRRRASLFISMLKKTSGGTSEGDSTPHPRSDDIFDDADSLDLNEPAVKRPRFSEKPLMSGVGAPSNDSIRVTQDLMAKVKAASKR